LIVMRMPSLAFCSSQLSTSKLASSSKSEVAQATKRMLSA
jgi:hypothetical protein